jgi:hypothetical protein
MTRPTLLETFGEAPAQPNVAAKIEFLRKRRASIVQHGGDTFDEDAEIREIDDAIARLKGQAGGTPSLPSCPFAK